MSFDFIQDVEAQLPSDIVVEFGTGIYNPSGDEHTLFVKFADDNCNPKLRQLALANQAKLKRIGSKKTKTSADLDQMDKALITIYAKSVITDWQNITADGKVVPYSVDNCVDYLTAMKSKGAVWDELTEFCTEKMNFMPDNTEPVDEDDLTNEDVDSALGN